MLNGMLWLLGCQLLGEVLVAATDAPVPGPVVGMVLLFVALQVRRPPADAPVFETADRFLRHLQLLFIPPGVGIVVYLGAVRDDALPIAVSLVASWLAGLAAVAYLVVLLSRRRRAEG